MSEWITTRPHDEECVRLHDEAKKARLPQRCVQGCRHGQPWPTLRLLPSDHGYVPRVTDVLA